MRLRGFIGFLLLDEMSFRCVVLEAKSEEQNPIVGKEQARKYAKSQNCRFVLLSNGNLHLFWDLEHGKPCVITALPTPAESDGLEVPEVVTAGFTYRRLRRPSYSEADLERLAAEAREQLGAGRDVYMMFKHEDDPSGALNAERLLAMVRPATAGRHAA